MMYALQFLFSTLVLFISRPSDDTYSLKSIVPSCNLFASLLRLNESERKTIQPLVQFFPPSSPPPSCGSELG